MSYLPKVIVTLFMASSCRPQVTTTDAQQRAEETDAAPPAPHLGPTEAGIQYFSDIASNLEGPPLVLALHEKLSADHVAISFADLFTAYETTDGSRMGCEGIFDFYSSKCWTQEQACGAYTKEGDCFNREHSWPKSWWGGGAGPDQHEDLVAVIPADGYVNNNRGQLPLGEIVSPRYTSTNGSRRGLCVTSGTAPATYCFEPPDSLKGDLARIYFYMAVRYEGDFACCDDVAVNGADIKPWQEDMLRRWHALDTVDIWERDRNEAVFSIQKNRNPFVDYPDWVERIADF